jgi:histidinol dehydrogenase
VTIDNQKSETEINEAIAAVSPELKEAILLAKSNITKFHAQKTSRVEVETIEGVNCWQEKDRFKSRSLHSRRNCIFYSTYACRSS